MLQSNKNERRVMKLNFYLVQISISNSSPCFLPYATGCIYSYLKSDSEIMACYNIPDIVTMRENPHDVIKRFKDPDVVGFSNYVWNAEYNKKLAQMLKEKYPKVKIIFAGHQISPDGSMLE